MSNSPQQEGSEPERLLRMQRQLSRLGVFAIMILLYLVGLSIYTGSFLRGGSVFVRRLTLLDGGSGGSIVLSGDSGGTGMSITDERGRVLALLVVRGKQGSLEFYDESRRLIARFP